MANFNLSGVKASEEVVGNVARPVQPGYQVLTILGLQDTTAATGATGLEIEFKSNVENTIPFKQKYWLNNADGTINGGAPAFANVVKAFTGAELPETVNTTQAISALLVGKSKDVTVGGRRYTSEKEGKKYNNIQPELPFGSFDGDRGEPRLRGEWDAEQTVAETTETNQSSSDGLPW